MKTVFSLVIVCFSATLLFAQDTMRTRYGFEGGVGQNMHETDFRALPGVPNCCPQFASGKASAFAFNFLYERPIGDLFFLGARVGYMSHDALLTGVDEPITPGDTTRSFNHTVNLLAGSIGLEPRIGVRLFDHVLLSLGVRGGILMNAHYSQNDHAIRGTFSDSSSYRNQSAGTLPNTNSILFHGIASIAGEFAADKGHSFYVSPEVTYMPALNDLVNGVSWKANALMVGISFKYSPQPKSLHQDSAVSAYADVHPSNKRSHVPLSELPYSLTKSPFISPKIVKDLSSWNSEGGDQVVEINLTQSQGSERYSGRIDSMRTTNKFPFVYWYDQTKKTTIRPVYFGYEYLGETTNGAVILHTSNCNGDSTVLHYLMIITIVRDSGLAYDASTSSMTSNPWIGIKKIGEIPLGNAWKGKVGIEGNRIFIAETPALFEKKTGRMIDLTF